MKTDFKSLLFFLSIAALASVEIQTHESNLSNLCLRENRSILTSIVETEETAGGIPSPAVSMLLIERMNQSELDRKCDESTSIFNTKKEKDYFLSIKQLVLTRSIYEQHIFRSKTHGVISARTNF